jgi:dephospho-CoA kinase
MLLFGLTGGIASGKSSVSRFFKDAGIAVIDADLLAREVVAPGSEGLAEIVSAFGPGVLDATGALDRKRLGERVFSDPEARKKLNAIAHPRIAALSMERAALLASEGHALACYEAALLVENGLAEAFRPLVVVAVSPDVQLERLCARDALTKDEAIARIQAQLPLAAKIATADFVIDNSGSIEETHARAAGVLDELRRCSVQNLAN